MEKKLPLFVFCVLALISTHIFAQTAKQKQKIISTYKVDKLKKLERTFETEFEKNYNLALQLAAERGWPLKKKNANNSVSRLMGVTQNLLPIYYTDENQGAGITARTNKLYPNGGMGLNLTGAGMTMALWEGGSPSLNHELFEGRVIFSDDDQATIELSDHATHVAGTLIGGASFNSGATKGMAYEAQLKAYSSSDDAAEVTVEAANGNLVSSHSYGVGADLTPAYPGQYDGKARAYDEIMYNAPYYLGVFSAGNDGGTGYDLLTDMSCNKNGLTVAAVEEVLNYTGPSGVALGGFSSWGPTDDGRIKPDISAKGVNTYSSNYNEETQVNEYSYKTGTSMATPSVAGTVLLLQQHYHNVNSAYMKSATARGLVCHTADETGSANGPDYKYGWGLINAQKAAQTILDNGNNAIISELTLTPGNTYTIDVTASGLENLMASITWTDRPGEAQNNVNELNNRTARLINDLDIRITDADNNTYFPWKLNPETPSAAATQGDNSVDNIEKIDIENPSGTYTITVSHKGTLDASQNYTLIVTGLFDNLRPSVNITSHEHNQFIENGTNVTLETQANDPNGSIVSVEFIVDSTTLETVTNSPYNVTTSFANGIHTIKVIATDNDGNTVTQEITLIVGEFSDNLTIPASYDGEERIGNGKVDIGSSDLEFVYDSFVGGDQISAVQFSNLNIPKGATITSAYIQFTAKSPHSSAATLLVSVEAAANPLILAETVNNFSERTYSAPITWTVDPWTSGDSGTAQQTPDLSALIQNNINNSNWNTGQSIVVKLEAPDDMLGTTSTMRRAHAMDASNSSYGPVLHLSYTVDATTLSIPETALNTSSIAVYPNPTEGVVYIKYNENNTIELSHVEVYDMLGRRVQQVDLKENVSENKSFNLDRISTGHYLLKLVSVEGSIIKTQHLIVK